MTDTLDYGRYGLPAGNPYVNRELDPGREADSRLFLPLRVMPPPGTIEAHIAAARDGANGFRSAAFLLSGRSGAGRSTLARVIFHRYREAHGIDSRNFHIVHFDKTGHDSLTRIHKLIKDVRNEVKRAHPNRRDELMEEIPDGGDRELDEYDLQTRADFLEHVMTGVKPRMHLGLLVAGVQEDAFMDAMAEVFRHVSAVVVVTRNDYPTPDTASGRGLRQRRRWQQWAKHLELPPLGGSDVEQIATNRWHAAAGDDLACPFELDGVRTAFDKWPEPLTRAIRWLAWLLRVRLKLYEGADCWPDAAELRLPAKWIVTSIEHAREAPHDAGPDDDGDHPRGR
jgi:hypothetical protein